MWWRRVAGRETAVRGEVYGKLGRRLPVLAGIAIILNPPDHGSNHKFLIFVYVNNSSSESTVFNLSCLLLLLSFHIHFKVTIGHSNTLSK